MIKDLVAYLAVCLNQPPRAEDRVPYGFSENLEKEYNTHNPL